MQDTILSIPHLLLRVERATRVPRALPNPLAATVSRSHNGNTGPRTMQIISTQSAEHWTSTHTGGLVNAFSAFAGRTLNWDLLDGEMDPTFQGFMASDLRSHNGMPMLHGGYDAFGPWPVHST